MAERIVVGFLTRVGSATGAETEAYLARATALRKQAEALGGRLCAWEARSLAFDFAADDVEKAIGLAISTAQRAGAADEGGARGMPFSVGIAQGEMQPLMEAGSLALPSWGPPLVRAISLARVARAGQVLIDPDMPCVAGGELLAGGSRAGKDAGRRVRGVVLDGHQLWRRDAAANVKRLGRPELVGRHGCLTDLLASHAPLALVRAAPGFGGTRVLEELGAALAPGRSLFLPTAGAEPRGAVRRAFARAGAESAGLPGDLPEQLRAPLDGLLRGDGARPEVAAELVAAWVTAPKDGAVLVDDAMEIDDPSLDAVVAATRRARGLFRLVVRIDARAALPAPFEGIDLGPSVLLGALPRPAAEQLVASCAAGGVSSDAAKRWAHKGRCIPLGMVEALAEGVTTGEVVWVNGVAVSRDRRAGMGQRLDPRGWILRRLQFVSEPGLEVLTAVALLGIEVPLALLENLLASVNRSVDVERERQLLGERGWLRTIAPGICSLPSRSHREVMLSQIPEAELSAWHRAASETVEKHGGPLALAEAARHAALAKDAARAASLAHRAADVAGALGLEAAENALRVFAGPRTAPPEPLAGVADSLGLAPTAPAAEPAAEGAIAAKTPIDSWIEALRSAEDREGAPARLDAISALSKGAVAQALRVLREGVAAANQGPPAARSRALLAHAIGLAIAGRPTEALLEALGALARAREGAEPKGEQACARFLERLATAAGHPEAALQWQKVEQACTHKA